MGKFNIQRYKNTLVIDVLDDADLIVLEDVELNGLLHGVLITAPDLDDTDTYTFTIKQADGAYTVFTRAALAESAKQAIFLDTNNHPLRIPLSGLHDIEILTSGDQAADRTFLIQLLIQRG